MDGDKGLIGRVAMTFGMVVCELGRDIELRCVLKWYTLLDKRYKHTFVRTREEVKRESFANIDRSINHRN